MCEPIIGFEEGGSWWGERDASLTVADYEGIVGEFEGGEGAVSVKEWVGCVVLDAV